MAPLALRQAQGEREERHCAQPTASWTAARARFRSAVLFPASNIRNLSKQLLMDD